ncbi:FAD-binding oxidoreductase [Desulfobulbus sp.]|uniref:FAD-binding oxidoreductase n=1 Tax=Desulfobulbus sp. TaxID=895 RepID=UPI0027BABCC2|nr:FAD-linked oxidase C-terminal domain-containing protein [Desulfobulbus sp.]
MFPYNPLTDEIIALLQRRLSPGAVVADPAGLKACAVDASTLSHRPELVVRAQTVDDVQTTLKMANQYNFPVTPRGGGSGLAGGCLPHLGGVVLSTRELCAVRAIDAANFTMEVEAGAISSQVREAAAAHNLFYPPDPAGMDLSTIGGNAATDAGGPACVKYGTTRDYILGLEAVLPDGTLINTGVRTRKGVVGYDLTNLLVGCEGTLAVITALTLKLIPRPPATVGALCAFASMGAAMRAVARIMAEGHLPSAIEFLDHRCLALVGELLPFELPTGKPSLLLMELDGPAEQIAPEMETVISLATNEGAIHVLRAPNEQDRQRIWEVRRQVSLRIHDHAVLYIPEDVAVPLSAIARLVDALPDFEARYAIEIFAFGHAGDGNIHLNITTQYLARQPRAEQGVKALLEMVLELGGTISGEHGIGLAKKEFLPLELSPASIRLQQGIKQLFDPNLILNPGKIFP